MLRSGELYVDTRGVVFSKSVLGSFTDKSGGSARIENRRMVLQGEEA